MIITLPLPHKYLKPNTPTAWRYKHPKIKEYRAEAKYSAMSAAYDADIIQPFVHSTVQITAYWPTAHKTDPDNLIATMKAAMDGFTDAGIWLDDRDVTYLPCRQEKDASNPRIEIEVLESTLKW